MSRWLRLVIMPQLPIIRYAAFCVQLKCDAGQTAHCVGPWIDGDLPHPGVVALKGEMRPHL